MRQADRPVHVSDNDEQHTAAYPISGLKSLSCRYVHGDMKPENLVLGRTTGGEPPRLHLVDLGLSAFILCCFWHCCQCWLPASG